MSLAEKIKQFHIDFTKNKHALKSITSICLAKIQNKQIELGKTVTDSDVINIIRKEITVKLEEIEWKSNAERDISLDKDELEFLEQFVPKMLSEEETKLLVADAITILGTSAIGPIMSYIKTNHGDKVDMSIVKKYIL